jgi:putative protease
MAKRKPAVKKKSGAKRSKPKASKRKAVKRKAVPKRKPAKKAVKKKAAKRPAAKRPVQKPKPAMEKPPAPPIEGQPVGKVTHYYSQLGVAVVQLDQGGLRVGDTIRVKGHTTDFTQTVESMEIEHQRVPEARPGQVFGLKVIDHAREHDVVYKI